MPKELLILPLVVINIFLGLTVYSKGKNERINRSFLTFSVAAALWSLAIFLYTNPLIFDALFWIKITYFLSIFTAPALYYFFSAYSVKYISFNSKPLIFYLVCAIPFSIMLFSTDWWIVSVNKESWGYDTITGPAYPFFGALAAYMLFVTFKILVQKLHKDSKEEKNQTIYILLGISLYSISAFIVDVIFPVFFGISKYFWTSPISAIFFIAFTTLAITKYHLFEIKVILTELLVGIMGAILLVQIFLSDTGRSQYISLGILAVYIPMGCLLVRATHLEIKRRLEVESLAKDLEEANIQIQSVEKMKSDLINMASHEFRTPIGIIKNSLWFLNKKEVFESLSPKSKSNLEVINRSIERLDSLLQNMTEVLAASAGDLTLETSPTQIEILINDVIESKRSEAEEKNIALEFKEPKRPLPQITADQTKLKYVLWELLNNSLKYTDQNKEIDFAAKKDGDMIKVEIADNGKGIPEDKLHELFNRPFIKGDYLHTTQPGMGLGLYVVKNIMDLHHGDINISSHEGTGTKVTLVFPIN